MPNGTATTMPNGNTRVSPFAFFRAQEAAAKTAAQTSRSRSPSPIRSSFNPTTAAKPFQLPVSRSPTKISNRAASNRATAEVQDDMPGEETFQNSVSHSPTPNRTQDATPGAQASRTSVSNSRSPLPIFEGPLEVEVKGRLFGTNWESRHFTLYPDKLVRTKHGTSFQDIIMLKDIVTVIYDFKQNNKNFIIILEPKEIDGKVVENLELRAKDTENAKEWINAIKSQKKRLNSPRNNTTVNNAEKKKMNEIIEKALNMYGPSKNIGKALQYLNTEKEFLKRVYPKYNSIHTIHNSRKGMELLHPGWLLTQAISAKQIRNQQENYEKTVRDARQFLAKKANSTQNASVIGAGHPTSGWRKTTSKGVRRRTHRQRKTHQKTHQKTQRKRK